MEALVITYSSGSVQAAKNLVQAILDLMKSSLTPDDIFYYGVFCNVYQYSNNIEANIEIQDIPPMLINEYTPITERTAYVNNIINQVLTGEIERPQWMIDIEQDERCGDAMNCAASTELHLLPKSEEYKELGERMIEFLYSLGYQVALKENRCCSI